MKKIILNSLFLSVFLSSSLFSLGCETLDIDSETPVAGRVESTAIIPPRANPNRGSGGAIGTAVIVTAVGIPLAKKAGEVIADQTPCKGMTEQKCDNAVTTATSPSSSKEDKDIATSYIKYCCP